MTALEPPSLFHLYEVANMRLQAAAMIHAEFWAEVPGVSLVAMADRLALATSAHTLPLCRIAVSDGKLVGIANLIDYDDPNPRLGRPWLAGLVVTPAWRGRGLGSRLVRALLDDGYRLGEKEIFLGTDSPKFYERLGAARFTQLREDFWLMRFSVDVFMPY